MSLVCYSCGKGSISGNLVSHAKNRSKRRFKPNLHVHWIKVGNKLKKAKFCAKCMRRVKAMEKELIKVREVQQVQKVQQVKAQAS